MSQLTPVKERDYLDQDPELRGQKYVCLSFISPEDIIQQKEVYVFNKFLGAFMKDVTHLFENIKERFKDDDIVCDMLTNIRERYDYIFDADSLQKEYNFFKETNSSHLDREYLEQNDFQTSVRGIKVRGVYETLPEARNRANVIKKFDPKFDVYVAEVGCWCPWSPHSGDIENQEYSETQLNTLMKKYRENLEVKDEFYRVRMEEMVKKVKASSDDKSDQSQSDVTASFETDDPWTKKKNEDNV